MLRHHPREMQMLEEETLEMKDHVRKGLSHSEENPTLSEAEALVSGKFNLHPHPSSFFIIFFHLFYIPTTVSFPSFLFSCSLPPPPVYPTIHSSSVQQGEIFTWESAKHGVSS